LCKITEITEQFNYETYEDYLIKKSPLRQKNNNTTFESSMYLTTDPNLSPQTKDLLKLKKLIKFNFKKYNEPPTTTSEFYRIGRILGRGAFGKVNLAAHKLSE
jgi:hypothetical protein